MLASVLLAGAFTYSRCFRPRAGTHAALVVSTPQEAEAATCGIAPISQALEPRLNLSLSVHKMEFGDRDHKLAVNWEYRGGAFHHDVYRFTTTFDGITRAETVSLSDGDIVLLSHDGYELTLHPDREDVYAQVP